MGVNSSDSVLLWDDLGSIKIGGTVVSNRIYMSKHQSPCRIDTGNFKNKTANCFSYKNKMDLWNNTGIWVERNNIWISWNNLLPTWKDNCAFRTQSTGNCVFNKRMTVHWVELSMNCQWIGWQINLLTNKLACATAHGHPQKTQSQIKIRQVNNEHEL